MWVPTKDTGIDLLVTDRRANRSVSLQVKFSRDYLVTHHPAHAGTLRACGWWTLNPEKLAKSEADYWVLLLAGFDMRTKGCLIRSPVELAERFRAIRSDGKSHQSYFWVTRDMRFWETRGLSKAAQFEVAAGTFADPKRDFSIYLNDWSAIESLDDER